MKITVRNIGPVSEAAIDLKPLTVFVGPNNAGKTWTAYLISVIVGSYALPDYVDAYGDTKFRTGYPPLEAAIRQIQEEGTAKVDLIEFGEEYGDKYFSSLASFACQLLPEFLGGRKVSFDNLGAEVELGESKSKWLSRILSDYSAEGKLGHDRQTGEGLLNGRKDKEDSALFFYTSTSGDISLLDRLPAGVVRSFVAQGVFRSLQSSLFSDVYIFPTERTTFITFPYRPVYQTNGSHEEELHQQESSEETSPLAGPARRLIELVIEAFRVGKSRREKQAEEQPSIAKYMRLSQLLERGILGGEVDFSTPEVEPGLHREILYQLSQDVTLDMTVVSSMVKELSPLVLYLRYVAEQNQLVVIDEPEMNLHPEAQVRLAEFLAMMVDAGLNVLITTHSPYIVDHLINLMKAAQYEDKEAIRKEFYLQRTEAFVPKEDLSVYLFENGSARSILDDEGFIDWQTFSNTSERISQIYFEF